jgi:hypothetical protein
MVCLNQAVLNIFKPKKFTATLFADLGGHLHADESWESAFKGDKGVAIECSDRRFVLRSSTNTSFISEYSCLMANFVSVNLNSPTVTSPVEKNKNLRLVMESRPTSETGLKSEEVYESS